MIRRFTSGRFSDLGGVTFLAGVALAASFSAYVGLPTLRGPQVIPFLAYYTLAAGAYFLAVVRLGKERVPLAVIWGFALLFRLLMLLTSPTLRLRGQLAGVGRLGEPAAWSGQP